VEEGIQIHTVTFESNEEEHDSSDEDEDEGGDEKNVGEENGGVNQTDIPAANVPLVMVHGLGGSVLAFHKNFRKLSANRVVYGIDLPGFGLSSRQVKFPSSKEKYLHDDLSEASDLVMRCEKRMIELIEKWRKKMKIEKMILLGHSFGGYLSARYALAYPDQVQHLVMVDPWGIFTEQECREMNPDCKKWKNEGILKKLAMKISKPWRLNPFDFSRAGGNAIGK